MKANYLIGSIRSQRKRAEQAVWASEVEFHNFITRNADGITIASQLWVETESNVLSIREL